MNARQLEKLGIPSFCAGEAIAVIQRLASQNNLRNRDIKETLKSLAAAPDKFLNDDDWGSLAHCLSEANSQPAAREPIAYPTWGDQIDPAAHAQMRLACQLPMAVGAALMPDAHVDTVYLSVVC